MSRQFTGTADDMSEINGARRKVLVETGLVLAASTTMAAQHSDPWAACAGQRAPPSDVGRKFYADGRVRPFAGNTIICHLPQQDAGFATFDTLLDIYRDLPAHGFARKLAILPPSSYHMTLFGGANDQERKPGLWPADVPLDTPTSVCDTILGERLRGFKLDCALPFRMRVIDAEPAPHPDPILVDLAPVDSAEERKLRSLRDRFAEVLKIRAPDHDRYAFHISIAYPIDWLTDQEQSEHAAARRRWRSVLKRKIPVVQLGAPEYCTFDDMFAFRRRLLIS
jgi:hypothetical protein